MTMSLVALHPGCQTCNAFGFGVGTAVEAEAVVLAVVVLAVVAVEVLAAADAALTAVEVDAAEELAALAAELVAADVVAATVVAGAVVVADEAVTGADDDWLEVDTVAEAPQAARPTAASTCTLAASTVRRDSGR